MRNKKEGSSMPQFSKKPVIIEAIQVPEPNDLQAWGTLTERLMRYPDHFDLAYDEGGYGPIGVLIHTLEGTVRADIGDWIIQGVAGEHYPCKPDIFEATYEPLDDHDR